MSNFALLGKFFLSLPLVLVVGRIISSLDRFILLAAACVVGLALVGIVFWSAVQHEKHNKEAVQQHESLIKQLEQEYKSKQRNAKKAFRLRKQSDEPSSSRVTMPHTHEEEPEEEGFVSSGMIASNNFVLLTEEGAELRSPQKMKRKKVKVRLVKQEAMESPVVVEEPILHVPNYESAQLQSRAAAELSMSAESVAAFELIKPLVTPVPPPPPPPMAVPVEPRAAPLLPLPSPPSSNDCSAVLEQYYSGPRPALEARLGPNHPFVAQQKRNFPQVSAHIRRGGRGRGISSRDFADQKQYNTRQRTDSVPPYGNGMPFAPAFIPTHTYQGDHSVRIQGESQQRSAIPALSSSWKSSVPTKESSFTGPVNLATMGTGSPSWQQFNPAIRPPSSSPLPVGAHIASPIMAPMSHKTEVLKLSSIPSIFISQQLGSLPPNISSSPVGSSVESFHHSDFPQQWSPPVDAPPGFQPIAGSRGSGNPTIKPQTYIGQW